MSAMEQTEGTLFRTYPSYISPERIPLKVPHSVVTDGNAVFGAFDGPFRDVNLMDAHRPLSRNIPDFFNRFRIKEWEAYEVSFDEGFVCGAIYDAGIMTFNIMMFYDLRSGKVTARQVFGPPGKCAGNTLINSANRLKTGGFSALIDNQFQTGKVYIKADCAPDAGGAAAMSANLTFTSCAKPTVTVMPLGENRPLYTHKELFHASGTISIGGEVFHMSERSLGIIDDHKGFYPRHMHYDWVTCVGNHEGTPIGINLCTNQCSDPNRYSENILWKDGLLHLLPPVVFKKLSEDHWSIKDSFGAVELDFRISDSFRMKTGTRAVGANYRAPFGQVSGHVLDNDGHRVEISGLTAMGEDIYYNLV